MADSEVAKLHTVVPPRGNYHDCDPSADLSPTEREMYDQILARFSKEDYVLPNADKGALTEQEKFWLSRECLLRYLRASKWKLNVAIQRLESTLKWRRDYGIYDKVNAELVEPEAVTGKEILFGYDKAGRPGFYMIPSRQNTTDYHRQIQFAVWMLERCVDLMEPGVETLDLLINFKQRAKSPNISQSREVLHIIQDHYPERLGKAIILNVPFAVNAIFKLIRPFIDPVTANKMVFNTDVVKEGIFDADMLMNDGWPGSQNFEYVHEKYWASLLEATERNVDKWMARWKVLGAKVGVSEWEYKSGGTGDSKDSEAIEIGLEGERKDGETTVETVAVVSDTKPVLPPIAGLPDTTEKKDDAKEDTKEQTNPHATPAGHVQGSQVGAVGAGAVATSGTEGSGAAATSSAGGASHGGASGHAGGSGGDSGGGGSGGDSGGGDGGGGGGD